MIIIIALHTGPLLLRSPPLHFHQHMVTDYSSSLLCNQTFCTTSKVFMSGSLRLQSYLLHSG
uniref:Uncharacterized protein n=1 Tax=Arion vulgaris TaxID=1028688 RepID=A0A0B6XX30_9EUPU